MFRVAKHIARKMAIKRNFVLQKTLYRLLQTSIVC